MHTLIQDYTNKSLEMEIFVENGLYALKAIKVFFPCVPLWLQNVSIYGKSQSSAQLFCLIRKKWYHVAMRSYHLELYKRH